MLEGCNPGTPPGAGKWHPQPGPYRLSPAQPAPPSPALAPGSGAPQPGPGYFPGYCAVPEHYPKRRPYLAGRRRPAGSREADNPRLCAAGSALARKVAAGGRLGAAPEAPTRRRPWVVLHSSAIARKVAPPPARTGHNALGKRTSEESSRWSGTLRKVARGRGTAKKTWLAEPAGRERDRRGGSGEAVERGRRAVTRHAALAPGLPGSTRAPRCRLCAQGAGSAHGSARPVMRQVATRVTSRSS
jgi:hypothetical protein